MMTAFLTFLMVMSFTPGPNTILAMNSGQKFGFTKSIPYNFGVGFGVAGVSLIAMLLGEFIKTNMTFVLVMKVVGSLYLLYLAYHVLLSKPVDDTKTSQAGFWEATALQFSNVKAYLYAITSFTGFLAFEDTPLLKILILAIIGMLGTLAWTLGGAMIKSIYNRYYRLFNVTIALLLVYSCIDLW